MNRIKIVFGKEEVKKIESGGTLSKEEIDINVREYEFYSKDEKIAFIKGMDEAMGWLDYCIILNKVD